MNYEYALMDEEISNFEKFRDKHSECNPKRRAEMAEESTHPTYCSITLWIKAVGALLMANCHVCGRSEAITCDERLKKTYQILYRGK